MLSQNKKMFTETNILGWHKEKYTGKGVNIAVVDDAYMPHPHTNCIIPLNDSIPIKKGVTFHKPCSCSINREIAPDSIIYALNWFGNAEGTVKWLEEHKNDIDVINCSFDSPKDSKKELVERMLALKIPCMCSTGNRGGKNPLYPASMPGTIKISSCDLHTKEIPKKANRGEDLLTMTHIYIPNSKGVPFPFEGTSASASAASAMLALYIQWRKERGLPKLTPDIALRFMLINAKPMLGSKLFVLPKSSEIDWKNDNSQNSYVLDETMWLQ